jgi:hypothetical protein
MVSANFNSFVCISIPRECNRVAHELAALGCVCAEGDEPIVSSLPECIIVIVADEQSAHG